MEFTSKTLEKMKHNKFLYSRQFASWYYRMYLENGGILREVLVDGVKKLVPSGDVSSSLYNKGDRIASCCNLWIWNLYEKNKLMDLKRLNRCKNSRFCPNCKALNVQKFIHEFKRYLPQLQDYDFYLMTLTCPSCDSDFLSENIDKLYSSFQRLNRKFSASLFTPTGKRSSQALQYRLITLSGGVRVLEITYNDRAGYHPHIHSIVLVPKGSVDAHDLIKKYCGRYSNKRESYNMKSEIDVQVGKVWSMLWYGIDFRKWDSVDYSVTDEYMKIDDVVTDYKNLEVDFTPLDDGGIYEVFKYTFKSSDVKSYEVFKALNVALEYRRIRQGFGVLHNLKCEDDSEGEYQELCLDIEEEPIEVITREFDELLSQFKDYKKISRYNPSEKEDFLLSIAD